MGEEQVDELSDGGRSRSMSSAGSMKLASVGPDAEDGERGPV